MPKVENHCCPRAADKDYGRECRGRMAAGAWHGAQCKLKHYGVGAAHMNSPGTVLSNRDKARSLPSRDLHSARKLSQFRLL